MRLKGSVIGFEMLFLNTRENDASDVVNKDDRIKEYQYAALEVSAASLF